jgi:hypothetical protein
MFWLLRLELEDGAVVADDLQGRDRQQLSHPLSRVRRIDEIEIAHIARDEIRHQALVEPVRIDIELQKALNPPGEIRIDRFGWTFCPGDKVMQVENDYDKDVYNGDLGVVSRIDTEESELAVDFEGREVTYGFGELMSWYSPTRRQSTRAKARNTRLWSSRSALSTTRCCSGTWSTRG